MEINYNKLVIGDRLVRQKGGVFSNHHAIYVGFQHNQYLVAENQYGYGVRLIPLQQFLNEGRLIRVEYNNASYSAQQLIVNRINQRLGRGYDLWNYNCEHFVNEVLHGKKKSPQIEKGASVGLGLLVLFLVSRAA